LLTEPLFWNIQKQTQKFPCEWALPSKTTICFVIIAFGSEEKETFRPKSTKKKKLQ